MQEMKNTEPTTHEYQVRGRLIVFYRYIFSYVCSNLSLSIYLLLQIIVYFSWLQYARWIFVFLFYIFQAVWNLLHKQVDVLRNAAIKVSSQSEQHGCYQQVGNYQCNPILAHHTMNIVLEFRIYSATNFAHRFV